MALMQNIEIAAGINLSFKYADFNYCTKNTTETLENAYIRIDEQNGNKDRVLLEVGIYTGYDGILVFSENYDFIPSVEEGSDNFIKQGYEYLKTLTKFTNAIDC